MSEYLIFEEDHYLCSKVVILFFILISSGVPLAAKPPSPTTDIVSLYNFSHFDGYVETSCAFKLPFNND